MLQSKIERVLDEYNKNYSSYEIRNLISRWERAKSPLLAMLRKHPNWDENALGIVIEITEERELNRGELYDCTNALQTHARENDINTNFKEFHAINYLKYYANQFTTKENVEHLDFNYNIKINEGQKTSRVVNKLYTQMGVNKLPEYNRLYAKIADAFNPLKVKRTSVLSVHPCDYLLMSNGNSWDSCHNIRSGCYMAGTLSYMGDETSMIFYTLEKEDDNGNEYYDIPKRTREVFCYNEGIILQSRLYPQAYNETMGTNHRSIVQKIIADCEGIPNIWTKINDMDAIRSICVTSDYSKHYPDYEYEEYNPTLSIHKEIEHRNPMFIGSTCYCIQCGSKIIEADYLYCDYCENDYVECDDCGARIGEDEQYNIDGYTYCEDCVKYCEECGEYTREDITYVECVGYYVCESCLNNHYHYCEECHEWKSSTQYVEDANKDMCDSCLIDYDCFICEECGGCYTSREYNEGLCSSCYEQTAQREDEVAV